jgi:hypothetical protein
MTPLISNQRSFFCAVGEPVTKTCHNKNAVTRYARFPTTRAQKTWHLGMFSIYKGLQPQN